MNLKALGAIVVSFFLSYLLVYYLGYLWTALISSIPLGYLKVRNAILLGLAQGLVAASLFLLYPIKALSQSSIILGQLAGLSSFTTLLAFPLTFAVVSALASSGYSGLYYYVRKTVS